MTRSVLKQDQQWSAVVAGVCRRRSDDYAVASSGDIGVQQWSAVVAGVCRGRSDNNAEYFNTRLLQWMIGVC